MRSAPGRSAARTHSRAIHVQNSLDHLLGTVDSFTVNVMSQVNNIECTERTLGLVGHRAMFFQALRVQTSGLWGALNPSLQRSVRHQSGSPHLKCCAAYDQFLTGKSTLQWRSHMEPFDIETVLCACLSSEFYETLGRGPAVGMH